MRHVCGPVAGLGLAVVLAGCAAPAPSATPTTRTPAGARPCQDGESPGTDGCYDPEALMRANKRFRERITPQVGDLAQAQQAVEPVRAALATLPAPVTPQAVTEALRAAGFPDAAGVPPGAVIGVPADGTGVSVPFGSACVYGDLTAGVVTLATGGVTQEGSCLPGIGGH